MSPAEYEAKFSIRPSVDAQNGYTMISAIHPNHASRTYYLSIEDYQKNLLSLLSPLWINCYTITMIPME